MKAIIPTILATSLAVAMASFAPGTARAAEASLGCRLDYSISGWSAIYKHSEGRGTVSCQNGTSMPVSRSLCDAKRRFIACSCTRRFRSDTNLRSLSFRAEPRYANTANASA